MNNRSVYPSYEDFTKDDEYAYCKEEYELFQEALDNVEKRTTKSINSLLQKYGYDFKVDYFDIQDTEMDEDGFDIHATIFLDGKGISTSKLQFIDFTLTGAVIVENEEHEYLDHSQIRYNTISPPYEVMYIDIICPDLRRLTEFTIDNGRESKFSIKDFLAKIEEHIKMVSKRKKGSSNRRIEAKDQFIEEGREETICDPMAPMNCTGVLRFKNGKPIPTYVMLRGFLIGVAVAQNDEDVIEKYGEDVLSNLELAIRGWLRKASGNAEYTLSDKQKKWINTTLGGKSGVLSPILRRYVVTECSKSGGCDLPDPTRFRFAGVSRYDIVVFETEEDRDQGESFTHDTYKDLDDAIKDAQRLFRREGYEAVEIRDSDGDSVYLIDSDTPRGEKMAKFAGKSLTIVPAYGRDYKSKKDVAADWNADKDFIVQDMMSGYDGSSVNKSDAKRMGIASVTVRYKQLRNVTVIKVATQDKIASRYSLPAKKGVEIVFGIDRAMGWFFQLWLNEDSPELDESFLSNGKLLELLQKYGKPSRDLDRAVEAVAMDMEPADLGVRGIRASHTISRKKKSKGCGCRKEKKR